MSTFSPSPAPNPSAASRSQHHRVSHSPDPEALADQMLDNIFADLEDTLNTPMDAPQSYPFSRSRPPLPLHQPPLKGGLIAATIATLALLGSVLLLKHGLGLHSPSAVPVVRSLPDTTIPAEQPLALEEVEEADSAAEVQRTPLDRSQIEQLRLPLQEDTAPTEGEEASSPLVAAHSRPPAASQSPRESSPRQITPPARTAAPGSLPTSLKLLGIMRHPGEPVALIVMNGKVKQVPLGQTVEGGWKVSGIAPYSVAISNGAQNVSLPLGREL